MPKVTIQFDLPEEEREFRLASQAQNYHSALWDINEQLRSYEKYGHNFKTTEELLQAIRSHVFAALDHYFINIDQ